MGRASTRLHGAAASAHSTRAAGLERDPLAEARERFLVAEPVNRAAVREPILASWSRSRAWNVPADKIDLSYLGPPDLDSALARAAAPVLRHLFDQLEGQPISIVLTDANGLVLLRHTGDRDLERHLDAIRLAPGFCYAEDHVGTNGIGTALESGGPAHVFGHEHYAERLEGMACAAAPVRDPLSGKTVGALDLTCRRGHADALMISLARSAADQLGQALAESNGGRNLRLLEEYARTCRHTGGIVLALGHDVVMLNDHARQVLSPADQAELISQAAEALARQSAGAVTVDLTGGVVARMFCHPLLPEDAVFHVKLLASTAESSQPAPAGPTALPGLVGKGAAWRRACRAADASYQRGEWLTVEGEAGSGKLALIRAVHQRRQPVAPCHVLDADDAARERDWLARARSELFDGSGLLIIRHLHALPARQARALTSALADAQAAGQADRLRVAVTLDRSAARADLTGLLRLFPGTVTVPPLRHHSEDVRELVPLFLGRLAPQGQVSCSPAAMRLLLRHSWPGNAAQLWRVLKQVVQVRRGGQILPADLPPECWTVSRRVLSPLESIERDAIVQSLLDHGGNKIRAARALGMSRATVYRRIHDYGIVTPPAG